MYEKIKSENGINIESDKVIFLTGEKYRRNLMEGLFKMCTHAPLRHTNGTGVQAKMLEAHI